MTQHRDDLHTLTIRVPDGDPRTGTYQLDGQEIKGFVSLTLEISGDQYAPIATLVLEAAVEGELALVEKTYGVRERLGVPPYEGAATLPPGVG